MPSAADLGPALSRRLTYQLKQALQQLEMLHAVHLADTGIDVRELAVLLLLDGRGPESQQQAAQRLGIDRTTMVGFFDSLEHKGLVARRPDPQDRRRNVVELTAAGRRTLKRATRASDKAERELLGDLGEQEAAQLRELLGRIGSEP